MLEVSKKMRIIGKILSGEYYVHAFSDNYFEKD